MEARETEGELGKLAEVVIGGTLRRAGKPTFSNGIAKLQQVEVS